MEMFYYLLAKYTEAFNQGIIFIEENFYPSWISTKQYYFRISIFFISIELKVAGTKLLF